MEYYYYDGTIVIDNDEMYVEVEVHAEASGYWKAGDSFGYGCEPPDEDFEIDEVEYLSAIAYDEEGKASPVEITDEIKKIVMNELSEDDFEVGEPDFDEYHDVKEAEESAKKKPFNNYHSKEEQELNRYKALTDYCDM